MKKIFLVFIVGLFSCVFAKDVIKVGISPDYPPFEYMKDGEIVGFDRDLVVALADEVGVEVKFVSMNFDGLIAALSRGKIDMIASGMAYTKERAKRCEFTQSYYDSITYFVKLKSNTSIKNRMDLVGKKVGAQTGSAQAEDVNAINGAIPVLNSDPMVFIMATLSGKVDAFVLGSITANEYIKKYEELEVFDKTEPGHHSGMNLAFKKGDVELRDKFDNAINTIKGNGVYKDLLKKHNLDVGF